MSITHSNQIRIRQFESSDLEPVVAMWNDCLPKDPITIEKFWRFFLLDPNFRPESAFVAESDGKPIGFLQAVARRVPVGIFPLTPTLGYITTFFVEQDFRQRGIGRSLVQKGLAFLRNHGCQTVTCNGYVPFYAFPGVDIEYAEACGLLNSMGFRQLTELVAMGLPLRGVTTPPAVMARASSLASEGFMVRQFELADTLPLLSFMEEHFPHWHQSLIDGLQIKLENVFVAMKGTDVVGFAQWENPQTDPPSGAPGRFGPFGVHPDLRNNGLGSVLFYQVIEQVSHRGADTLWFGWAGGRNLSFYERAGCRVTRQYTLFRIDLTEGGG